MTPAPILDIYPGAKVGQFRFVLDGVDITDKLAAADIDVRADGTIDGIYVELIDGTIPDDCLVRYQGVQGHSNGANHG